MASRPIYVGAVSAFDEHVGLGEVITADGAVHPFHCTAIADGTRRIEVGAAVVVDIVAGHLGQWEASRLVVAPSD